MLLFAFLLRVRVVSVLKETYYVQFQVHNFILGYYYSSVANQPPGINWVNVWHGDVGWCHKVTELKAGLLTRRFKSSVFCGRVEVLLAQTFLTFKIFYMHKNLYKTLKVKKQTKNHNRSPLNTKLKPAGVSLA